MIEDKADTEATLAAQQRAVKAYDVIDGDLSSAEEELTDAREALAEAQKEIARLEPLEPELQGKLDSAFKAWEALSDQLDAAGIDEQYRIDSSSAYGVENYG